MKKKTKRERQGNIYDRIFRENAQLIFIPLIEMQLGLKIKDYQPFQDKISKTVEREVDFLYLIKTEEDKELLLHIEFQTENDKNMLLRMQEYHGLISRKHELAIRHVVIYLGKGKSTMKDKLEEDMVFRGFEMINLYELDRERLLSNQVPEVVLLALLSDFGKEQIEAVLRLIVMRLKQLTASEKVPNRYVEQLLMLSRLRNLESEIIKIIKDMPITYDIKKDVLYQQGIEQGIEQNVEQSIIGLYKIGIPVKKIVEGLGVPLDKVEHVLRKSGKIK